MEKGARGFREEKAMGGEAGEVARARPCGTVQVSLRILFLIQRVAPGNDTMIFSYWEGCSSCSTGMSRVDGMGNR